MWCVFCDFFVMLVFFIFLWIIKNLKIRNIGKGIINDLVFCYYMVYVYKLVDVYV